MAEKTSELGLNDASDANALSTINAGNENSLQTRAEDYQSIEAASDEEATDETEQLRERIVETRREMGETIDAIQEKLSFQNISEQVKDQVSEQINGVVETAKDVLYGKAGEFANSVSRGFKEIGGTELVKKAQQNPAALAIIGAGIGALLVGVLTSGRKRKNDSYDYDYESFDENYNSFDDYDSDDDIRYADSSRRELTTSREENDMEKSDKSKNSTLQTTQNKISNAASSAAETVSDAATSAYSGVTGAANSAYQAIGGAAGKTYEGISTAAGYTYDKAGVVGGKVKDNYDYYIEENPLVVGAVAFALGAIVGLAIPLTQKENEYMGEYRDNLLEKAQTTAQDAIGTVKQMATEAQKVITEEVKSQTA